jgi:hypothetical protein
MIHARRLFQVTQVATAEELATKLTEMTWVLCQGFRLGELLFVNDSFSGDGAQEYAVFRGTEQVESVTFGWCKEARALELIRELQAGANEHLGRFDLRLVKSEGHACQHCA